mgnify:CR=1 FL=1
MPSKIKRLFHRDSFAKRLSAAKQARQCADIPKVNDAGKVTTYKGAPVQIMHNGVRIFSGCYHGERMTKIIEVLKGHHEPQEEKVFHEVLRYVPEDGTMLEVGCFWAYYSLWFSHQLPKRKNFLIEPVAWKRVIAELNFILNEKSVEVDSCYIEDPEICLQESTASEEAFLKDARAVSIDAYMVEKGLDRLDILHADIQGAELSLLQSATHSLESHSIDYLFLSTHKGRHTPCIHFLKERNYKIIAEHTPEESHSADGLIVAAGLSAPFRENIPI